MPSKRLRGWILGTIKNGPHATGPQISRPDNQLRLRRAMPPPIRLYIAVADGSEPGKWEPFSAPLRQVDTDLQQYEAEPADVHYSGAKIGYLLRPISEIEDDDTLGIVAVLVDGKEFADDEQCPKVAERARLLRKLGDLLKRQLERQKEEPYYQKYGFRLWLVTGDSKLKKITQIARILREPLKARGIDHRFEPIPHPAVLEAVVKTAALEAVLRQSGM
jgi:hypothetical protein